MSLFVYLPLAAGIASLLLALASLARRKRSVASWCFAAGMVVLGADSILTGFAERAATVDELLLWLTRGFVVEAFVPMAWLGFSLTYSRGNARELLARWRVALVLLGLLPVALAAGFSGHLLQAVRVEAAGEDVWGVQFGPIGVAVNVLLLVSSVLILMNIEQTFRSAVGTMRWRIKFVVLAVTLIFGAHLYVRSQAILFSAPDLSLWGVESGALLIGCFFLAVAYARTGLAEIDVYPSLAVLRSSFTIIIVGGYLFVVGVVAQLVRRFGGAEVFQFQAFVVLLGMAGLAVLLLSDRARHRMHALVARHFRKAQHDSVQVWTQFSRRLAKVSSQAALCKESAALIVETFDALSVTVWLLDEETGHLTVGAATTPGPGDAAGGREPALRSSTLLAGLRAKRSPFYLEDATEEWANEWRGANPSAFTNGGNRLCVPLHAGDELLGALVLADRVGAAPYTLEELELLGCIADQVSSMLVSLRLGGEVARARELEAFRTMSAFFVHDLKNAAASLNLTLKNLAVHFDDPEFRQDALRGIGRTASRIDGMIARLAALREHPERARIEMNLSELARETLARLELPPDVQVTQDLRPVSPVLADGEQIQSVVTNLVLNARDALNGGGRIQVRTEQQNGRVCLSVADTGCGMSGEFIRDSLFRPFQSTKKGGLGIGLFQARAIVQAHGGGIQVDSEVGKGTTFVVSLPAKD